MPDLLELIAESDASVLSGWAAAMEERRPQLDGLSADARSRELLTLAREFTRRASWAVETAVGWLEEFQARLRVGMGGHKVRALVQSGQSLCGMCRSVVEIAGDLWKLTGEPGGEALTAITQRLAAVEAEITKVARVVALPLPEISAELIERAKENMAKGAWLTPEQARAAVRKAE
jgi:hypothetical protein